MKLLNQRIAAGAGVASASAHCRKQQYAAVSCRKPQHTVVSRALQ